MHVCIKLSRKEIGKIFRSKHRLNLDDTFNLDDTYLRRYKILSSDTSLYQMRVSLVTAVVKAFNVRNILCKYILCKLYSLKYSSLLLLISIRSFRRV